MKKKAYQLLSVMIIGVSSLFVLTGSMFFIYKPAIPEELRKKVV